jgi:hypothetical protein
VAGGVVVPLFDAGAGLSTVLLLSLYRIAYISPDLLAAERVDRAGDEAAGIRPSGDGTTAGMRGRSVAAAAIALVVAIFLVLMSDGAHRPGLAGLIAVDFVGMVGTTVCLFRAGEPTYRTIVLLDVWVGFPLITWLFWLG